MDTAHDVAREGDRKVWNYRLIVRGVWGRNRKVKFETFMIVRHCPVESPKYLDELLPLARAKLAEIKFKMGKWQIDEDPVTVKSYEGDNGRVLTSESFMLMSSRKMHEETVS